MTIGASMNNFPIARVFCDTKQIAYYHPNTPTAGPKGQLIV